MKTRFNNSITEPTVDFNISATKSELAEIARAIPNDYKYLTFILDFKQFKDCPDENEEVNMRICCPLRLLETLVLDVEGKVRDDMLTELRSVLRYANEA